METEVLAEGHAPLGRTNYLWQDNLPDWVRADDANRLPVPPVTLDVVRDVELRSDYMAYEQGKPILIGEAHHMDYVPIYLERGLASYGFNFAQEVAETIRVREPLVIVSHFNMSTYGHFLLEVLPKVLQARRLAEYGREIRIAFPATAPYVIDIVRAIVHPQHLFLYDSRSVRVLCDRGVFPSMLISHRYDFHRNFVSLLQDLVLELQQRKTGSQYPPKVFLSRERHPSLRRLTNESALSAAAREQGYEVVHPQELDWVEQVCLFAGATHLVGEYSSALHNHMFAPAGARVMSISRVNAIVANVTATLGQRLGYVFPNEHRRDVDASTGQVREDLTVNVADFARRLAVLDS